jgi:peptidase E/GNAT superfamily N-acetyltransferase
VHGRVILASSDADVFFEQVGVGQRVALVPTAANGLADRDAIVEPLRRRLHERGASVVELDLGGESTPRQVKRATADVDAVLVAGGNPFALCAMASVSRWAKPVTTLLERGGTYCGISAGAMLAAPDLSPLTEFSPFRHDVTRSPQLQRHQDEGRDVLPRMSGLGIVDLLVMPHDDRPGRRTLHEQTLRRYGRSHRLVALHDGECVAIDADGWQLLVRPGLHLRPARAADAGAIAALFVEAGRVGWAAFLSPEQIASIVPDVPTWIDRIETAGPDDVTVAVDHQGVAGFIWVRQAIDLDLAEPTGEVATFYTHPRVWGSGVGRRLMALGLDRLRAMGYTESVLWTEERNERPRRIYASNGWVLDGAARTRDFHGFPINELRHRFAL